MPQKRKKKGLKTVERLPERRVSWAGGSRLINMGRAGEVERFRPQPDGEGILTQCWNCNDVQRRQVDIFGKVGECWFCGGPLEMLG